MTVPRLVLLAAAVVGVAPPVVGQAVTNHDTLGALTAVAAHLRDRTRKDSAAAQTRRLAPPSAATWFIEPSDHVAEYLATQLGIAVRPLDPSRTADPPCPWTGTEGAPIPDSAGYIASVRLEFESPARARVVLTRRCDNPPGFLHDIYGLELRYELRRRGSRWRVIGGRVSVT